MSGNREGEAEAVQMSAPALYWVCLVYLILMVAGQDYYVVTSWPLVDFPYSLVAVGIVAPYNLASIAFLFRSRLTVPFFLLAFAIFAVGEAWAIAKTGLGPGFSSGEWLTTRSALILIVLAITYYCYRLTRRGFLR
jgi:hypothetical protein